MKTNLKTKTARLMLEPRAKPWKTSLGHGLTLGYRRLLNGAGTWTAIFADGKGGQDQDCFATADDQQPADGAAILDYRQASERAIHLAKARGQHTADASRPATIDAALTAYADDLRSRGQNQQNASMVRHHLGNSALLSVSLAQVTQEQLGAWCDSLLAGGIKRATLQRMLKGARAAFNLASKDRRIAANSHAWKKGFPVLRDATHARNAVIETDEVRQIVSAAYDLSDAFGLWVHVHAETGSRSSQIARLTAGDLAADHVQMPNSGKGRDRMGNKNTWTSVPIKPALAARLRLAAAGKRDGDPLLVEPPKAFFRKAVQLARIRPIDGKDVTIYALRHSSIVRGLKANVPAKTVADWHNTSIGEIEKHYARYMRNSHDALIRPALLDLGPVSNVVPIAA